MGTRLVHEQTIPKRLDVSIFNASILLLAPLEATEGSEPVLQLVPFRNCSLGLSYPGFTPGIVYAPDDLWDPIRAFPRMWHGSHRLLSL